ncbi:glyoxylate/hydroxypyruvate reductase HPR3-like [Melia azedarach]|uniref:Glyoxylate/hydroxypyruvate reductase HPR3-like n=1 Tax=Melia azedarach TaxID=155640 RepID=A0ACC1YVL0_MELAZ|nr:glyoxylate/hydroxypyruvate reductase HPR3-like [Melia azedarach]
MGGKRVGIVRLGSIDSSIEKRLDAFGCYITYNSRKEKLSVSCSFYSNVCELAANTNILIIRCGLTEGNRHLINKEDLLALGKEGVIILLVARGPIIEEKELVQCSVQREIKGS